MAEEISLNPYFAELWRAKWLIVGLTVIVSGAAWFYTRRQPAKYNAVGVLQIGRVWKDQIEDPYVTTDMINSPGFAHELAPSLGLKAGQLRKSVHAETVTAGSARSSYPVLVRVTTTTGSSAESVKLAEAVVNEIVNRHNTVFDQALAPHLAYQHTLESLLQQTGATPDQSQTDNSSQSRTLFGNAHQPTDLVIKLERELQDVTTANTAPTYTERTHIIDKVVASGSVMPEVLRPAVTAGMITLVVAIAMVLLIHSLSGFSQRFPPVSGRSQNRAAVPDEEVQS